MLIKIDKNKIDIQGGISHKLDNGDEYQFRVKNYNEVTFTQSELSEICVPLSVAPKPRITGLEGTSTSARILFACDRLHASDVRGKLYLKIKPFVNIELYRAVQPGLIFLSIYIHVPIFII